jgi:DNA invertase Pin-like site-specific DNA recombinase
MKYKVAGYVRLSKEQYDNKESNSITNQKQIINKYVSEHGDLELVDFYIDDGHTGTDFNRPGFDLLLGDLKNKKIDTIIVKDLSRFGRNYIEAGNYIENIFPMMNVRFISINDNIDTKQNSEHSEYIIPFKNIFNEYYSKDISTKVRSVLKNKKINGEFIGRSAPYGYLKDPQDKHKFIIDKEASKTIIKIFNMALSGKTRREISDELNSKNIFPPALYKIKNNISNYKETNTMDKWNPEIVNRILRNVVYTGDLVQNKSTLLSYRIHKVVNTLKEDWIITENHHDAIISKEVFEKVQNILDRKKGYFTRNDFFQDI